MIPVRILTPKKGRQFNELDDSKKLTTLPSVYNVMAMIDAFVYTLSLLGMIDSLAKEEVKMVEGKT